MAKVTLGPIVTDARKRIGSVIYSKNRSGNIIQGWTRPPLSRTPAQAAVRDIYKAATLRWQTTLTEAQRNSWATAAAQARTCTPIRGQAPPTGYAYYIQVNARGQWSAGALWHDDPPTWSFPPPLRSIDILAASAAPSLLQLDCDPHPPPDWYVDVFVTPCLSPGRTWLWRKMQRLTRLTSATSFPYDAGPDFDAIFAASGATGNPKWSRLVATKKIGILARTVDTASGQPGSKISTSAIVTAGGDAMLLAKLTLTPSDILTLNTVPFTLVPAPGPGKRILPIAIDLALAYASTPYLPPYPDKGELVAVMDHNTFDLYVGINLDTSDWLAQVDTCQVQIWPIQDTHPAPWYQTGTNVTNAPPIDDIPLELIIDGASGPRTAGDSRLIVTVAYAIEDLT